MTICIITYTSFLFRECYIYRHTDVFISNPTFIIIYRCVVLHSSNGFPAVVVEAFIPFYEVYCSDMTYLLLMSVLAVTPCHWRIAEMNSTDVTKFNLRFTFNVVEKEEL